MRGQICSTFVGQNRDVFVVIQRTAKNMGSASTVNTSVYSAGIVFLARFVLRHLSIIQGHDICTLYNCQGGIHVDSIVVAHGVWR